MSEKEESPTSRKLDRKREFIRLLALFLADGQARKSIELEMGNQWAKEWAALRAASPLFGYPSIHEAVGRLTEFLA